MDPALYVEEGTVREPSGVVPLCPPGGVILDPFCGGGGMVLEALTAGRRVVAVDIDRHNIDTVLARLGETTARSAAIPDLFTAGAS